MLELDGISGGKQSARLRDLGRDETNMGEASAVVPVIWVRLWKCEVSPGDLLRCSFKHQAVEPCRSLPGAGEAAKASSCGAVGRGCRIRVSIGEKTGRTHQKNRHSHPHDVVSVGSVGKSRNLNGGIKTEHMFPTVTMADLSVQ